MEINNRGYKRHRYKNEHALEKRPRTVLLLASYTSASFVFLFSCEMNEKDQNVRGKQNEEGTERWRTFHEYIFFKEETNKKKDKKIQFHRQINHTKPLDRPMLCLFDFSHGHDPVLFSQVSRSLPGLSRSFHKTNTVGSLKDRRQRETWPINKNLQSKWRPGGQTRNRILENQIQQNRDPWNIWKEVLGSISLFSVDDKETPTTN